MSKKKLLFIMMAICVSPFLIAHYLYYIGWQPSDKANLGALIPITLHFSQLVPEKEIQKNQKWTLLLYASQTNLETINNEFIKLKQIQKVMGKNYYRTQRAIVFSSALKKQYEAFHQENAHELTFLLSKENESMFLKKVALQKNEASLFIVDPMQRFVLMYKLPYEQQAVFTDFKRLLTYSHIG